LVVGLAVWGGVIIASNLLLSPAGWLRYPLSWLNIEFMFGVLSAWVVKSAVYKGDAKRLIVLGLAVVSVMLVVIHQAPSTYLRLLLALGLACTIVGFALWEKSVSLPWPGWLLLIGNASYSIYLIHNPLLSVTQRIAARMGLDWMGAMLFGVALSILAGYVYYILVERRVLHYFRNKFARRSNAAVPQTSNTHS
jgi:exopolysaccharide production protein ExoZ